MELKNTIKELNSIQLEIENLGLSGMVPTMIIKSITNKLERLLASLRKLDYNLTNLMNDKEMTT